MKRDNFDEKLTEALEKYIRDTESNVKPVQEVKFSKRHEDNMEEFFKAIENGEFGNFENVEIENNVDSNKLIEVEFRKFPVIKFARTVAFIILGLWISLSIAPSITAWRSEDTEFYGKNQDDYAWLLRNDTTEILEPRVGSSGEYAKMFGYLPEGFEITAVVEDNFRKRIDIKNNANEEINLKIVKNLNNAVDMKDVSGDVFYIDDIEIRHIKIKEQDVFVWNHNNVEYHLYSEIDFEMLYEVLKNIKFKNF